MDRRDSHWNSGVVIFIYFLRFSLSDFSETVMTVEYAGLQKGLV